MARFAKVWPAALSGLLVVACFPPLSLFPLCFLALIPWLWFLRSATPREGFRSGLVFGWIFWLGEFSFVAGFVSRWTHSLAMGLVPYLVGCFLGAFYFGFFGWLAALAYHRRAVWLVPILWAGIEVFRSYLFGLAFPFGLLATPLTPWPALIQSAHYGTVFFVSAWVALASVFLVELAARNRRAIGLAVVFVAILGLSLWRYAQPEAGRLRTVAAGQPGIDMAFSEQTGIETRIAERVNQIEREAMGVDLLVLPEGITHAEIDAPPPVLFKVSPLLPLVFGGQRGEGPAYQSAFAYDGEWRHADKTRLVIFGEYVPFREYLPFLKGFDLPGGDLQPGADVQLLPVAGFQVGSCLCFEALFPDVPYREAKKGANLLAVMSIDDWYFGTNAPPQLRDATNWRAIESGMPAVRAASLGYSIISDARGRTVAQAPLAEPAMIKAQVRVPDRADLFPGLPVFPYTSIVALLALPIANAVIRRRNPESS